jgi:hypothetical protein
LQREPPPIEFGCLSRLGNLAFEDWRALGLFARLPGVTKGAKPFVSTT